MDPLSETPLNFESSRGRLVDFDDGHVPETHLSSTCKSRFVKYPQHENPPEAHVYDNVLPLYLVNALYKTTVETEKNLTGSTPLPWGSYVTLDEARNYKDKQQYQQAASSSLDEYRKDLSVQAVHCFLSRVMSSPGTTWNNKPTHPMFSSWDELKQMDIHGVAVWCLASAVSSQVQYHLDYAELIRYEHNVIVPPIFAGTVQCCPAPIAGGDFCVATEIGHYNRHGYKGSKSDDEFGGWTTPDQTQNVDFNNQTSWITIPYKFNRGICHSGHLPHLSTPVSKLEEGQWRVIMGFNVFCNDIGPVVMRAPEHSNAFRRRIQLHRSILQKNTSADGSFTGVSLDQIRNNKGFTKLLVLAKRERIKQGLRKAQKQLDQDIEETLLVAGSDGVSVESLSETFGKTNGTWPSKADVQVHLHHRVKNQTELSSSYFKIRVAQDPAKNDLDKLGLLSPDVILVVEE